MIGFWIFMLIMNLLVPFSMIGIGRYFFKKAGPKEINMLSGYRTSMSMKNKDTWQFAHIYCGKLWRIIGWILLPISIITMILAFVILGEAVNTKAIIGGLLISVGTLVLVL